MVPQAYRD